MASIQWIAVKNAVGMLATDGRLFSGCKSINPVSAQKNLFGLLKNSLRFSWLIFPDTPEFCEQKDFAAFIPSDPFRFWLKRNFYRQKAMKNDWPIGHKAKRSLHF